MCSTMMLASQWSIQLVRKNTKGRCLPYGCQCKAEIWSAGSAKPALQKSSGRSEPLLTDTEQSKLERAAVPAGTRYQAPRAAFALRCTALLGCTTRHSGRRLLGRGGGICPVNNATTKRHSGSGTLHMLHRAQRRRQTVADRWPTTSTNKGKGEPLADARVVSQVWPLYPCEPCATP